MRNIDITKITVHRNYKMENNDIQKDTQLPNEISMKDGKTSENFQKFIHEVFEKNGVLNDLRAYLRSHIINVLKSVHTGETIMCQKHFAQRLEPTFQALNMLIVEYLLCLDFSYSLSVFISEIPLANMVFDLAKSLLLASNTDVTFHELRFKDSDVWRVLNFMGLKCDSKSASNIVDMYKNEQRSPLLLCILKCIPFHVKEPESFEEVNISDGSASTSSKTSDISYPMSVKSEASTTCKHYAFCKNCQRRFKRMHRKYRKKKSQIQMNAKTGLKNVVNVETCLRNVEVIERSIINEMFEQLKTVYEAEVEIVREEEEKKIKRSLANHSLLLQKRYNEMEESFKAREAELENNVQEKKKFLWGLARALREQHSNMSNAMKSVKSETERLTAKEESLKSQISEAEQMLMKRGDEMQSQISSELIILEGNLNSMKRERDLIDKERSEIEKLRDFCHSNTKISSDKTDREELHSHYNMLKNELLIIKNALASSKSEPKCVIEKGVMTDNVLINTILNNEQELERNAKCDDSVRTPNQVINDLKKQKNVNFNQINLEETVSDRNRHRSRSRSAVSTEADDDGDLVLLLREENERLKTFADQQREHIDELTREQVRLRSELAAVRLATPRPRTAPAVMPNNNYFAFQGINPSAGRNTWGWRKGAGEELSVFAEAQPRILVPGDTLPFVGVLTNRHADSRRHLINQWRSLRRFSPPRGVTQRRSPIGSLGTALQDNVGERTSASIPLQEFLQPEPERQLANDQFEGSLCKQILDQNDRLQQRPEHTLEINKTREKSPKSVLREAKQKLRNKDSIKHQPSTMSRVKSPNSMLREAKLRLRKLEIEAEAVEKSYLDFRNRRSDLKDELSMAEESVPTIKGMDQNLYIQQSRFFEKHNKKYITDEKNTHVKEAREFLKKDFDKYLSVYQSKYNISESHFVNTTSAAVKITPQPKPKFENANTTQNVNYIETSLTEFRKLYHNPKSIRQIKRENHKSKSPVINNIETQLDKINDQLKSPPERLMEITNKPIDNGTETNRLEEMKVLKEHTSEMYGSYKDPILLSTQVHNGMLDIECISNNSNKSNKILLKVEVENVTKTKNIKTMDTQDDIMIVVQSSVDTSRLPQDDVKKHIPPAVVLSSQKDSPANTFHDKLDKRQHNDELKDRPLTEQYVKSPDRNKRDRSKSPGGVRSPSMKQYVSRQNRSNGCSSNRSITSSQPEKPASRNDMLDVIFHTEPAKDASSVDVGLDNTKDGIDSLDYTELDAKDYPDDFSADVDNYNSHSELENSPISLPKTSEDENFWD